jgi:predicted GH43/DUF377 family glycosyl hydrolase
MDNTRPIKLLLLAVPAMLALLIVLDCYAEVPKKSVKHWSWEKHGLPVIEPGLSGKHDQSFARAGHVLEMGDETYRMYYVGRSASGQTSICMATAPVNQPTRWSPWPDNPVFVVEDPNAFDSLGVDWPCVVRVTEKTWYMYYSGHGKPTHKGRRSLRTGLAISQDAGLTWRRHGVDAVLPLGEDTQWDVHWTASMFVLKGKDKWRMWYAGSRYSEKSEVGPGEIIQIGLALSDDGLHWEKYDENPVIRPRKDLVQPFEHLVTKPNVVVENGLYRMWFMTGPPTRIGYAESRDGIHWDRWNEQAGIDVSPEGWDSKMIEYAFVLPHREGYRMWYTGNGFGKTGMGFAKFTP